MTIEHRGQGYWKLTKEKGVKEFWKQVVRVWNDWYDFADLSLSEK